MTKGKSELVALSEARDRPFDRNRQNGLTRISVRFSFAHSLRAFCDDEVRCVRSGNVFRALIAQLRCVNTFQKTFSCTEEDRRHGQVHLVDKSGAKVLPDRGNPAAKPDILTVRSVNSSFKGGVNAIGDKVEGRASAHVDRCAWVAGEHENRSVERRIIAPPSLPNIVWPGSPNRSEHVSANDPRSGVVEAPRDKVVINTRSAAILTYHLSKGACADHPFVQPQAADAKWIVEILIGAGTVAIEGDRKAVDAKLGHKLRR